jgi:recombination protein RecR
MALYIRSIENLINEFKKLPGIGPKTAKRLVYFLIKQSPRDIERFAQALTDISQKIKFCKFCFNLAEDDICEICKNIDRDTGKICIVEEVSDVSTIEGTGQYRGLYHVLGNLLSPIDNIGPEEVKIPQLLERIKTAEIEEIIIALNSTVEGESTATYIKKILKPLGIKVTRLASGLPVGGDIEYADEITLGRAISDRKEF